MEKVRKKIVDTIAPPEEISIFVDDEVFSCVHTDKKTWECQNEKGKLIYEGGNPLDCPDFNYTRSCEVKVEKRSYDRLKGLGEKGAGMAIALWI